MKHVLLSAWAALALCSCTTMSETATSNDVSVATKLPSEMEVRQSYLHHGSKAQLYRWYTAYEHPLANRAHQFELLREGARVTSGGATATGLVELRAAIESVPDAAARSHRLTQFDFNMADDQTLNITAQATYQNLVSEGTDPIQREIAYSATLLAMGSDLPKFTTITISPGEARSDQAFAGSYVENRLLSLVHNWMFLVENPTRKAGSFRDMLAPEFNIDFGTGAITSYDQLAAWVEGPVSSMEATRHVVHNFSYVELGGDRYQLTVDLDWAGIRPDGRWMTAETRHTWTVTNNPVDRFPRIEKVKLEMLKPFAIVE